MSFSARIWIIRQYALHNQALKFLAFIRKRLTGNRLRSLATVSKLWR